MDTLQMWAKYLNQESICPIGVLWQLLEVKTGLCEQAQYLGQQFITDKHFVLKVNLKETLPTYFF